MPRHHPDSGRVEAPAALARVEALDGGHSDGEHAEVTPARFHDSDPVFTADGATYEGGFEEGVFSGEGTYKWADGASYVGGWKAGRMHGEGCYTDTDKVEWKGAFHNGSFFNGKAYATLR